jgi:hypothetical protein
MLPLTDVAPRPTSSRHVCEALLPMRPVQIVLLAIVAIAVPLLGLTVWAFLPETEREPTGPAVDSGARIELEMLRQQLDEMQEQMNAMQAEIAQLGSGQANYEVFVPDQPPVDEPLPSDGQNQLLDRYPSLVLIANRRNVNRGLSVASPSFLEGFLGRPRDQLSDTCEPITNPKLKDMLVTEQVGPITVQMLRPAIDSLKSIFEKVQSVDKDLYDRISTAGSLCVRRIRGTTSATSTHSFGLAIDLNIDGALDTLADGRTQVGLTILADFFRAEGWIWGAGYTREDSMHFEVSREQLETWRAEGKI